MAIKTDLVMEQGATFTHVFYVIDGSNNPSDLTAMDATSQMKRWYSSLTAIDITAVVNASAGTVTLSKTDVQTANISAGRYVYDTMLTDQGGNKTRVAEGIITVTPGVTNTSIDTTANTYTNANFTVVPLIG